MKVLGFMVTGKGRSKTIRATSVPVAVPVSMFRPSTDTKDTDEEGPYFDLVFPLSLYKEKKHCVVESESESEMEMNDLFFNDSLFSLKDSRLKTQILNSPSKFHVLKLGLKKRKSYSESESKTEASLFSLFARENSSRSSNSTRSFSSKLYHDLESPSIEEKKIKSSQAIQKYLSKIKPFYVKVSKGFGEKLVARRRLRKSKSASSAMASVRSPATSTATATVIPARRDDTLSEKEDGIEGAIAHCKRSFNNGLNDGPLVRSRSDPGEGKRAV